MLTFPALDSCGLARIVHAGAQASPTATELPPGHARRRVVGADVKSEILKAMLGLLPRDPTKAVTRKELRKRFYSAGSPGAHLQTSSQQTNIRRYVAELMDLGLVGEIPPENSIDGQPRYHLVEHRLYSYFMHSKVALGVHWTRELLQLLSPALGDEDLGQMTRHVRLTRREQTIRDRVRIVPDGIGRQAACIKEEALQTAIDALEDGRMVRMRYKKPRGDIVTHEVSVLGLAQKDGTIYLIACRSTTSTPRHFAMHRVTEMALLRTAADLRPDFDIDAYIEEQHQLAHVVRDRPTPVRLELSVSPDAIFHFRERPLPRQEPIDEPPPGQWYRVTAIVPHSILLIPFLMSHAHEVEVIGPPSVRSEVVARIRAAAVLHAETSPMHTASAANEASAARA